MGKQNAVMKSWVEFVKKTRRDMSKKGKKVSYKDAMKEASRRKKQWKRGGAATGVAANAATIGGRRHIRKTRKHRRHSRKH